nr:PREDICTED: uncharacterized protein LOC104221959 [Nicotiana sylvestris]
MEVLEREEDVSPRYSFQRNGSSLSCVVPPFLLIDNIPKKSLSYNKLPEEPLKLTVLKLDGSSFDIKVARNATVAELKQAVEAAFSHFPKAGTGKVSWSHVWGHFCLSYDGTKLLTDSDLLGTYRIKDGDKLSFMRHVSISYNLVKTRSEREDLNDNEPSISKGCEVRQRKGDQEDNHHQPDLGNHQNNIHDHNRGVVANCESRLVHLFRGWFPYKLASPERRITRKRSASRSHDGFLMESRDLDNNETMANMIMASSKAIITSSPSPRFKLSLPQISLPKLALPKLLKSHKPLSLPSNFKSISVILASSLAIAPPSLAEEIEKASLFDFNLTLPIIMAEFLFLMFALDKLYFSPLGKFMDERDSSIKEKLNSVKDTSAEVKQLEDQAAAIMKAARAEISAALNKMKRETQLEVEQKTAEGRKKVEAELQEALASLDKQKEETIKSLDSQIAALSDEIVKKVLPVL